MKKLRSIHFTTQATLKHRGSWGTVNPCERIFEDKSKYSRIRERQKLIKERF